MMAKIVTMGVTVDDNDDYGSGCNGGHDSDSIKNYSYY